MHHPIVSHASHDRCMSLLTSDGGELAMEAPSSFVIRCWCLAMQRLIDQMRVKPITSRRQAPAPSSAWPSFPLPQARTLLSQDHRFIRYNSNATTQRIIMWYVDPLRSASLYGILYWAGQESEDAKKHAEVSAQRCAASCVLRCAMLCWTLQ